MAEKYFFAALRQVKVVSDSGSAPEKWEPLLNNLGHTCRKLGRFEEALNFHRQALVLKPETASTYSAIGYIQTLQVRVVACVDNIRMLSDGQSNLKFDSLRKVPQSGGIQKC